MNSWKLAWNSRNFPGITKESFHEENLDTCITFYVGERLESMKCVTRGAHPHVPSANFNVFSILCIFVQCQWRRTTFFVIVFICYYVATVNGPTSITRLGVLKMCHQIASFWFSPSPTPKILICMLKIQDLMNVSEPGRAGPG